MSGNGDYRRFGNPGRLCSELQKRIIKSSGKGINLDVVRALMSEMDNSSWSEREVIDFFTLSPQKIFELRHNRLHLQQSSRSSQEVSSNDVSDSEGEKHSPSTSKTSTKTSTKTTRSPANPPNKKTELERAIDIIQKRSRKLQTKSQIEKKIVLAPVSSERTKIRLLSSDDDSDSDGDESPPTKDESKGIKLCDSESSDSDSGSDMPSGGSDAAVTAQDPEAEEARQMELRDIMRMRRDQSLSGFFDRKEQLDEERNSSHNLDKIYSDLAKYTDKWLTEEDIDAYLEFFRQLSGGTIEHLSTGSVVAAILDMYEVDIDKKNLKVLKANLQAQNDEDDNKKAEEK